MENPSQTLVSQSVPWLSMIEKTQRFLTDLQQANDLTSVWMSLSSFAAELGFDRTLLAAMRSRPGAPDPALIERRTSFPEADLDHYLQGDLVREDPLFRMAIRSNRPVAVHLGKLRRSLAPGRPRELLGLEIVCGSPLRMTFPTISGTDGRRWGFAVGGVIPERDVPGVLREAAPALWLASAGAALRLEALGATSTEKDLLTPREKECLLRLARGDRTDRIAEALGLSNATVDLHLANARRHLGARTSAEAVAKAILRGSIRP
jgi:DNA-binding CsgD family transcriptional regulator